MEVEHSKELIQRDIDERLTVPELWMDILRRLFINGKTEAQVRVLDWGGMFWEFCCSIRKKGSYDKPVFQSREWNKFVRYAQLRAGDRIVLRQENEPHFREIISFRITAQRMGGDGLWANFELPQRAASEPLRFF